MRRGTLSGRKKRRGCRQAVPAQCGYGSGLITAAAHELPQQRGLGNVVRRQGQEVVQEFQKPLGLQIFRAVMGHAEQQRLHIGLQQDCLATLLAKTGISRYNKNNRMVLQARTQV